MVSDYVKQILKDAKTKQVTDIHICSGNPVLYRIGKDLIPATKDRLNPKGSLDLSLGFLNEEQKREFLERKDYDLMLAENDRRYRVNLSYNDGNVGAVIRILPDKPKSLEELCLPKIVERFTHKEKGLVLITGTTSQGKTTTMSAMIDEINRNYKKHIVTIEDPIEYVHEDDKSLIRQREVGRDTKEFKTGLRAALRQDPDVIAIGEMRDYETIRIALNAAETGVLVLSTLHIISIDKITQRLLSYAPLEEEGHIRYTLADSLQGIVHQELLPTLKGGKRAATEILVATDAAKNILRGRGADFLRSVLSTGKKYGMRTMRESVEELLTENVISTDVANSVLNAYGMKSVKEKQQ